MSHQVEGVRIARENEKYFFHYETGTGKTPMAIEIIREKGVKTLVVAPLSILEPAWETDLYRFAPELKYCNLWRVAKKKRKAALSNGSQLYLINYDGFKVNYEDIVCADIEMIIVDESSAMKNGKAMITKKLVAFGKIVSRYCYFMSGTPAPNSELEWFYQIDSLSPGILGKNYWNFRAMYFFPIKYNKRMKLVYEWGMYSHKRKEFYEKISQVCRVVKKEDCLTLPEKVFSVRNVTLSSKEIELYNDMKRKFVIEFSNEDRSSVVAVNVLSKIMKLREITSGFVRNEEGKDIQIGSSKINILREVLAEIGNHKAVIWCNFRWEMDRIKDILGDRAEKIYGNSTQQEKDRYIKRFKEGDLQYLVVNPKSAKYGHTWTVASYAIYFSLSYSLEDWLQSQDRLHRYGQTNKVTYIILLVKGTIDEMIYNILLKKLNFNEAIINFLKK